MLDKSEVSGLASLEQANEFVFFIQRNHGKHEELSVRE